MYETPHTLCAQTPTPGPHQHRRSRTQKDPLSHHVCSVHLTKPHVTNPGVWTSSPISQTHRLTINDALCSHDVSDSTVSAQLEYKVDPLETSTAPSGITNLDPNPDSMGRFVYDPSIGTSGRGVDPPTNPARTLMDHFLRQSSINNDARQALYEALFPSRTADAVDQGSEVPNDAETPGTTDLVETLLKPGKRAEATRGSATMSNSCSRHAEQTSILSIRFQSQAEFWKLRLYN
jgi:hypothetical protein